MSLKRCLDVEVILLQYYHYRSRTESTQTCESMRRNSRFWRRHGSEFRAVFGLVSTAPVDMLGIGQGGTRLYVRHLPATRSQLWNTRPRRLCAVGTEVFKWRHVVQ